VLLSVGLVARLLMPAYARAQPAREDPNGSPSAVFHAQCALCHGEGGRADTRIGRALKVAALVNDARLAAMTAEQIATLVKGDPKKGIPSTAAS